jgi:hypothetical protein
MWPEDYSSSSNGPEHPEEELAAFALNALDGPEFQEVARHVAQCFHCQEVLVGFQHTAARLTGSAAEVPLPQGLKERVLAAATGPSNEITPRAVLLPADPRWSSRRLRRWLAPVVIGTLSLLLAGAVGVIVEQQREIGQIAAATQKMAEQVVAESESAAARATSETREDSTQRSDNDVVSGGNPGAAAAVPGVATSTGAGPVELDAGAVGGNSLAGIPPNPGLERSAGQTYTEVAKPAVEAGQVDRVEQGMKDVVEATMMMSQPETEKLPMTSPMGTEPEAKGVLIVDPSGQQAVLMVSGMPADSYQVWLVRSDKQMLVGRIVVNDDDGNSVQSLEMDESVFDFREVALMPDERHGPRAPTGEKVLTARIIGGPPLPPKVLR